MAEEVRADLTGTVWKVLVSAGDEVEEDDELIILESMKMEIPVESPVDGRILEIAVAEGDPVKEQQLLVRIEPD